MPSDMPAYLLDVNVLIALGWPNHIHHTASRNWFDHNASSGWVTTPVTELGFVRISSNRALMPMSTSPANAINLLSQMIALPGHEFWPDTIPLITGIDADRIQIVGHRQVSDAHLIALASEKDGTLVTFDAALGSSHRVHVLRPDR